MANLTMSGVKDALDRRTTPDYNQTNPLWVTLQRCIQSEIKIQVEDAVERAVKSFIPSEPIAEDTNFTPSGACDYLHISLPTLHRLFNEGKLHRIKVGRSTRISKKEIDQAISKGLLSNHNSK